jgi:hypothetical protein
MCVRALFDTILNNKLPGYIYSQKKQNSLASEPGDEMPEAPKSLLPKKDTVDCLIDL